MSGMRARVDIQAQARPKTQGATHRQPASRFSSTQAVYPWQTSLGRLLHGTIADHPRRAWHRNRVAHAARGSAQVVDMKRCASGHPLERVDLGGRPYWCDLCDPLKQVRPTTTTTRPHPTPLAVALRVETS